MPTAVVGIDFLAVHDPFLMIDRSKIEQQLFVLLYYSVTCDNF